MLRRPQSRLLATVRNSHRGIAPEAMAVVMTKPSEFRDNFPLHARAEIANCDAAEAKSHPQAGDRLPDFGQVEPRAQ
jgi:hypothetical protein